MDEVLRDLDFEMDHPRCEMSNEGEEAKFLSVFTCCGGSVAVCVRHKARINSELFLRRTMTATQPTCPLCGVTVVSVKHHSLAGVA